MVEAAAPALIAAALVAVITASWSKPQREVDHRAAALRDAASPAVTDRVQAAPGGGPAGGPGGPIEIVHDDPDVVLRLTARPAPEAAVYITDDELLGLLEEAGKSCGIIRTEGSVYLTCEAAEGTGPHRGGRRGG